MDNDRVKFLTKNLIKGLLWFAILLVLYVVFKDRISFHPESLIGKVSESPIAIYSIFLVSEVVFGIIPPELFMAWAAQSGDPVIYITYVLLLAIISYGAGVFGFLIGRLVNKAVLYRYARRKFFKQYELVLNKYGGFLIFVAALTPLPFSLICMLVGSAEYRFSTFLLISLTRFLRFGFYSYILWEAGSISL